MLIAQALFGDPNDNVRETPHPDAAPVAEQDQPLANALAGLFALPQAPRGVVHMAINHKSIRNEEILNVIFHVGGVDYKIDDIIRFGLRQLMPSDVGTDDVLELAKHAVVSTIFNTFREAGYVRLVDIPASSEQAKGAGIAEQS